jgi:hypothetical protein
MTTFLLPRSNPSSSVTCRTIGKNWGEEGVVVDFLTGEIMIMPLMLN